MMSSSLLSEVTEAKGTRRKVSILRDSKLPIVFIQHCAASDTNPFAQRSD
jgi:hypothetical protein